MASPVVLGVQLAHFLSWSTNTMGIAAEGLLIAQECVYLRDRQRALERGTLAVFDAPEIKCEYFYAGSDLPIHLAGDVFPIVFHTLLAVWLFFLWLSNAPGQWTAKRLEAWLNAYDRETSTWLEGISQIHVGVAILAVPVNVYGSSRTIIWRLATGYSLIGIGLINIFLGATLHKNNEVQMWRNQIKTHTEKHRSKATGANKGDVCMTAYLPIDGGAQMAGDVYGVMAAKDALRKSIKQVQ